MKIELVNIDDLDLDPRNARKHDTKNLKAIADSLELFGQRKPIVVWGRTVVAGNGTMVAARSLGWTEIQVAYVPDDWTADQVKAYALADNRSAELAEWDEQVLAAQLLELTEAEFDVELLGFEIPTEPLADVVEDEILDQVEPRAKLGDVWQLGKHRVMCGDSTDEATRAKLIAGATIDVLVTDPPYGIGAGSWKKLGKGKTNTNAGDWDNTVLEVDFLLDLAAIKIIWGGNYFTDVLPPTNDWLCWHKKNDGRTFSEFELAWTNLGKQARLLSHHWSGEEKQHITMKPSPVMDWCMSFLPEKCSVIDVFAGSGSTLLAAERTNRVCFAMELSPKYVDVIIARWEKLTGQTAELIEG
jgi:site-specific DNA-methyltransferase (adenine-specific)